MNNTQYSIFVHEIPVHFMSMTIFVAFTSLLSAFNHFLLAFLCECFEKKTLLCLDVLFFLRCCWLDRDGWNFVELKRFTVATMSVIKATATIITTITTSTRYNVATCRQHRKYKRGKSGKYSFQSKKKKHCFIASPKSILFKNWTNCQNCTHTP